MNARDFFSASELSALAGAKPLLLVSGGADSSFLFHIFQRLKRDHGIDFAVLHVNHGLRGEESDGDERFVREMAGRAGVRCFVERLSLPKSGNLQQLARQERWRICFELQKREGFTHALMAHHADDVLETLVMRLERGTGLHGLSGLRRWRELQSPLSPALKLQLFRPLIHVSKQDILRRLRENGVGYRSDSSNLSDKYLRNRVRGELARAGLSGLTPAWQEFLSRLQKVDEAFETRAAQLCRDYPRHVPLPVWESWPEELRFRFFALKMRACGYCQQVERRHFLRAASERVKLVLGRAHFFKDEAGCHFYSRADLRRWRETREIASGGSYRFGFLGRRLTLSSLERGVVPDYKGADASPWRKILYVDGDVLRFPLVLLMAGEEGSAAISSLHVKAFGRDSLISLKDLLQSRRFPWFSRKGVPVLKDRSGDVVAVLGVELSSQFRITEKTRHVLKIEMS